MVWHGAPFRSCWTMVTMPELPELQRLRADHAAALLAFELENRRFFAASILDRGDAYFVEFDERHRRLLELQASGTDYFHVLVEPSGAVVGRVNLIDVADGSAELGYRIAERVTGRGVATNAVAQVCELAATEYGLTSLRATTSVENAASQAVLLRNGFLLVGPVTLEEGRPGLAFVRDLAGPPASPARERPPIDKR